MEDEFNMKKRILSVFLAGILGATLLTGCGTNGKEGSNNSKQLVISTWGLNEDLLWENVFKPFEEAHGVKIVLDIGNNSERLTKMQNNPNSNIDITYLAESFAQQGIDAGIFEELDYSKYLMLLI